MKRKIMVFSSLATTLLATAVYGIVMTNKLMYIKQKDPKFIVERETKAQRFNLEWYTSCAKEELIIDSPNGYTLKGIFLKPLETNNTIIICHGVTENKMNSIKYARMFERLGYNTFVFDHRRHGDSGGKTTSYGYYEKFDLAAIVETVRGIVGEAAIIGIHGESMGAATTLLYAGSIRDDADFYIADCAFSDFRELLYRIVKHSIPIDLRITVHIADIIMRMRDGYSFRSVMPIEAVTNIQKPVLFIHSLEDKFILPSMTVEMYAAKKGPKMLKLFETGEHSQSFNENEAEYEQLVASFLNRFISTIHLSEMK
ncbi:alpha/beta fold hydrolase [Solibacillus sp. CAU 1738]|uniref:alpha/beta hydrolase n=1 Tax=Solibacillus sp. CAU 1738 TaxID=3140363 RepID=UPI00326088AC